MQFSFPAGISPISISIMSAFYIFQRHRDWKIHVYFGTIALFFVLDLALTQAYAGVEDWPVFKREHIWLILNSINAIAYVKYAPQKIGLSIWQLIVVHLYMIVTVVWLFDINFSVIYLPHTSTALKLFVRFVLDPILFEAWKCVMRHTLRFSKLPAPGVDFIFYSYTTFLQLTLSRLSNYILWSQGHINSMISVQVVMCLHELALSLAYKHRDTVLLQGLIGEPSATAALSYERAGETQFNFNFTTFLAEVFAICFVLIGEAVVIVCI